MVSIRLVKHYVTNSAGSCTNVVTMSVFTRSSNSVGKMM